MKHIVLLFVIFCLATVGMIFFDTTRFAVRPIYITAAVHRRDIRDVISASGSVSAVVTVEVSSQVSGQIAELFVDFNDVVREGQVIARLDRHAFLAVVQKFKALLQFARAELALKKAELNRARASLANAQAKSLVIEADIATAQAQFDETSLDLERKLTLSKRGTVSRSVRDGARFSHVVAASKLRAAKAQAKVHETVILRVTFGMSTARAEIRKAEAHVAEQEAELKLAEVQLSRTNIKAPIDGVVIRRKIDKGQTVAASLEAPTLFTIAQDLQKIKVETSVDEADIGRVRVGQRAVFTVDAYPDRDFAGKVVQIRKASELYENVVTYSVIISASNPDLTLFPGMTANVQIVVDDAPNALSVPNAALRFVPPNQPNNALSSSSSPLDFSGRSRIVWVLNSVGQPKPVSIRIGITDGVATEIVSDSLADGEEVITLSKPRPSRGIFSLWRWNF